MQIVPALTASPKTLDGICASALIRKDGKYSHNKLSTTVMTILISAALPVTNLEYNPNTIGTKAETP